MAGNNVDSQLALRKNVDSIEYSDRVALRQILDVTGGWRPLCTKFEDIFDFVTMECIRRNSESPTEEILRILGRKGISVVTLHAALVLLSQQKAASLLNKYLFPETEGKYVGHVTSNAGRLIVSDNCTSSSALSFAEKKRSEDLNDKHFVGSDPKAGHSEKNFEGRGSKTRRMKSWFGKFFTTLST